MDSLSLHIVRKFLVQKAEDAPPNWVGLITPDNMQVLKQLPPELVSEVMNQLSHVDGTPELDFQWTKKNDNLFKAYDNAKALDDKFLVNKLISRYVHIFSNTRTLVIHNRVDLLDLQVTNLPRRQWSRKIKEIVTIALSIGQKPVLDWFHCKYSSYFVNNLKFDVESIIKHSKAHLILQWLIDNRVSFKVSSFVVTSASNPQMLDLLKAHFTSTGQQHPRLFRYCKLSMANASANGNIPVLDWWRTHSGPYLKYDHTAIWRAVMRNNIASLNWWFNSGLKLEYPQSILYDALCARSFDAFQWMIDHQLYVMTDFRREVEAAIFNGDLTLVQQVTALAYARQSSWMVHMWILQGIHKRMTNVSHACPINGCLVCSNLVQICAWAPLRISESKLATHFKTHFTQTPFYNNPTFQLYISAQSHHLFQS
ncbi:hypothetical protein BCR44DRAFT_23389 [Catenaria anguillulae PL171]|uniref:Uncharacterized protein n=1 Tax=Catenaria anguillulae PL171 TaxID=765915 RepID=A0A1Y2H5X6_9FUNG|nr:hypothetical protein BCR44DRAFT_23389 [Catenaria anguillulae PL171]